MRKISLHIATLARLPLLVALFYLWREYADFTIVSRVMYDQGAYMPLSHGEMWRAIPLLSILAAWAMWYRNDLEPTSWFDGVTYWLSVATFLLIPYLLITSVVVATGDREIAMLLAGALIPPVLGAMFTRAWG